MPIFEYKCLDCKNEFEQLVFSNKSIACTSCASNNVVKKLSLFGMSGVEKQTSSGCSSCKANSCKSCKD